MTTGMAHQLSPACHPIFFLEAFMAVRMKLTDDEVTQIRAMLREGENTTRAAIAEQLGYRADTFAKLVARQQDARESFEKFSKPVTPYCALAKTTPKPRTTKAGRPRREVPELRIPDIEYWASVGDSKKRICDEMRIPLKVFNAQAKADDRLIEAFELGAERHAHRLEKTLIENGNDGGAQFLLKAKHGMRDTAPAVHDNRTQVLQLNIRDAMPKAKFLEFIEHA